MCRPLTRATTTLPVTHFAGAARVARPGCTRTGLTAIFGGGAAGGADVDAGTGMATGTAVFVNVHRTHSSECTLRLTLPAARSATASPGGLIGELGPGLPALFCVERQVMSLSV